MGWGTIVYIQYNDLLPPLLTSESSGLFLKPPLSACLQCAKYWTNRLFRSHTLTGKYYDSLFRNEEATAQRTRQLPRGHTPSKRKCGIWIEASHEGKPLRSIPSTTFPWASPTFLFGSPSPAQYLAQVTQSLLSKGYLIYYSSISTLCISEHLIKWAALSWPLSLSQQDWPSLCTDFTHQHTSFVTEASFYTDKKFQGSACFGRTCTKSGTIQGRLIISITLAKEWCAHLWWFHIC